MHPSVVGVAMLTYLLRRVLLMIPTIIGMTLMLFVIVRFAPGIGKISGADGSGNMASDNARLEQEQALQRHMGMIDAQGKPIPIPMQYMNWAGRVVQGDLGRSMQYRKPVMELILERAPITITLNIIATLLIYMIAIPGGMLSSVKRGRGFDFWWGLGTLALYSLPTMWVGSMLLGYLANPEYLGWFPSAGLQSTDTSRMTYWQVTLDYMHHLALPLMCMTYGGFAYLSKQMRASMLDNIHQDWARTARAKGVPGYIVVTRDVFRNSMLPLITMAAGLIPGLLGGSVLIEKIFSIKGMGELAYQATLAKDLPLMQGLALVGGVLTLISYLIVDVCYSLADPRVSYD